MSDPRPIGFFDSGLGGLTVLRTVRRFFPHESIVYLGDTARLPYGTKSPTTIRRYTEQNIQLLLKRDVKAIIVACNSASTTLLNGSTPIPSPVPVYNVIEPGARAALASSTSKRIGILGTRATVQSQAYTRALHALDPSTMVFSQAAPLLVPLVEEGWESDPLTNLIIYRYVAPLVAQSIDTMILGCTHYPALKDGIARVTGANVMLIDSGHAIAEDLQADFKSGRVKATPTGTLGALKLIATDTSTSMNETAARLLGTTSDLTQFELVDL